MNAMDTDHVLNLAATTIQALWRGYCVRQCITLARSQFIEVAAAIEGKEPNQLQQELTWPPSLVRPPIFRRFYNTCSLSDVENTTHVQLGETENVEHPVPLSHAREGDDDILERPNAEESSINIPKHLQTPLPQPLEHPTKVELLAKQENLLLELTWTSQAIKSREQYLILKHHLAKNNNR